LLAVVAVGLAVPVTLAALALASMLLDSASSQDKTAGVVVALGALLHVALPVTGVALVLRSRAPRWGVGLLVASLVLSLLLGGLLVGALEAAARP
jgi:hypothetical protein